MWPEVQPKVVRVVLGIMFLLLQAPLLVILFLSEVVFAAATSTFHATWLGWERKSDGDFSRNCAMSSVWLVK